jgi:hypothetical protein
MKTVAKMSISQLLAIVIVLVCFNYWAPWTASLTVAQATKQYPGQIDPLWRAVIVEHGKVSEWRLGTPRQNPVAFGVCTAALFSALVYLIASIIWMERHKKREVHAV